MWVFSLIREYCIPAILGIVWWLFLIAFIIYFVTYYKYGRSSKTDLSYIESYREMKTIQTNVLVMIAVHFITTIILYPNEFFTHSIKLGFIALLVGSPILYFKYGRE